MKKNTIFLFLLLAGFSITACKKSAGDNGGPPEPPEPEQPNTGFKTLDYLYTISGKRTIAGQQTMHYWTPMHDISGKYPGLWGEDFSFLPRGGAATMHDWRVLMTAEAKKKWAEGAVISLLFHACPPTEPEPCDWTTNIMSTLTDEQWNELITPGTTLFNNWRQRLDLIATYLEDLKQSGVEVLFRPFHEMNQGKFWWGGRPGPNGTRKLFQQTRDYFVNTKKLTNLIWVWNMQDFPNLVNDLNNYDPGTDNWDMLTLDIYGTDGAGYTSTKYGAVVNKSGGKPIAIGECAKLPSASILASQPKWTFFMGWAELTQQENTNTEIAAVYKASNVVTLDKMPGW